MTAVIQRPLRGSRVSSFYPVKALPSLYSLDSAFQLQEYISLLIRHNVHDVEKIIALPDKQNGKEKEKEKEGEESTQGEKSEEKDAEKNKSDATVDEACWIYEQLRRLAQDLTHPLITMLQQECTRTSCPEMKAGEWLYLCVAHGTDGNMEQCCAIDYILHTLDSATALLNSPRAFPSRLQIPTASHRHFTSLARRLGRIFAHAYFHHRDIFAQAEAESSLYARFLALTTRYDLVPPDFIVIPPTKLVSSGSDDSIDEGDVPRGETSRSEAKPPIIIPDPSEVQPPRLLAASLNPQPEVEKDRPAQRPTSAPPNTLFSQPSIRVISGRYNKNKNPPGLFVGGSGLIPTSPPSTTAAPTTAASLFASSAIPADTTTISATIPPLPSTLASGQESPRKTGRARTDTMIYTEGYSGGNGNGGRGTSPIPVVRLGARLNEFAKEGDEENKTQEVPAIADRRDEQQESIKDQKEEHRDTSTQPEPVEEPITEERREEINEPLGETHDHSSTDFEPIDDASMDELLPIAHEEVDHEEKSEEKVTEVEVPLQDESALPAPEEQHTMEVPTEEPLVEVVEESVPHGEECEQEQKELLVAPDEDPGPAEATEEPSEVEVPQEAATEPYLEEEASETDIASYLLTEESQPVVETGDAPPTVLPADSPQPEGGEEEIATTVESVTREDPVTEEGTDVVVDEVAVEDQPADEAREEVEVAVVEDADTKVKEPSESNSGNDDSTVAVATVEVPATES